MESAKKYIVYRHISPSKKSYIGITCQKINDRWKNGRGYLEYEKGKSQYNFYFINAIKKYGWENFKHEILCEGLTLEEAYEKEKYYIQYYNSFHNGYNATLGGEGAESHKVSEEARRKISQKNKGRPAWNKGVPCSEEMKQHLREINLGRKDSEETRQKRIAALRRRKNYVITEETRKKLSESHKGQPGYWTGKKRSPETIAKIQATRKTRTYTYFWTGKKRYPETIEKMRQANIGKKKSPETIEKLRKANIGKKMPPEAVAKSVATRKLNRMKKLQEQKGEE